MSISPYKTWVAGEVLTAADLNASFLQIINNARSLISPLTASLDMDGFELVMDADADSSLTADTDDRLDVRLGGFDAFRFDGTTASSVNGIDFVSAATTNPAAIQANGEAGAVVSLKDVGRLQFNSSTLTLSSGSVTGKRGFHLIAAESGTSDDFDTLATTNYEAGDVVYLQADSGDTIYVTTAGNFRRPMLLRDTRPVAVMWSGTKWELVQHGWVLLDVQTASASASLDFTKGIGSGFNVYAFAVTDLRPANDADDLWIRARDTTFQSDATDYEYFVSVRTTDSDTETVLRSVGAAQIVLTANVGNASPEGVNGMVYLHNPSASSSRHNFYGGVTWATNGTVNRGSTILTALYNGAQNPVDGAQFLFSTGNATSGSVAAWGLLQ